MFDVITIGGATRDIFFETTEGRILSDNQSNSGKIIAFEYGSKIVPKDSYFSYGGGGNNVATCVAKLGLKVAAKVNIGKEGTGSLIYKNMEQKGVSTLFVDRDPKLHTALTIIISNDGDHTMFLYRGANNNLKIKDWDRFKTAKWLYVSSLTGASENILGDLKNFVKNNDIKLAWNPGSKQLDKGFEGLKDILEVTSILILNKAEARELIISQNLKIGLNDDKSYVRELVNMGPEIAVMTDGEKGSYAAHNGEIFYEKAYEVKKVETTGAGDTYGATFLAGIIKGYDIKRSMRLAACNSASVVGKIGAHEGLKSLAELEKQIGEKNNIKA